MFCSRCGTELEDSAVFCSECGASVETGEILKENVPVTKADTKLKKYKLPIGIIITVVIIFVVTKGHFFHDWKEATCATPKTCTECNKIKGEPLGHMWQEATCTEPKTCSVCFETEGAALGHDWSYKGCTVDSVCKQCEEVQKAPGHKWEDATCENPKTCSVCSETEGEPLGHEWAEATCTEPKTCSICSQTEGSAFGHDWIEATCIEPAICQICGETTGTVKEHAYDVYGVCSNCGDSIGVPFTEENVDEYFTNTLSASVAMMKALGAKNFITPGVKQVSEMRIILDGYLGFNKDMGIPSSDIPLKVIVKVYEPDGSDFFDSEYVLDITFNDENMHHIKYDYWEEDNVIWANHQVTYFEDMEYNPEDYEIEIEVIPQGGYVILN